MTTDNLSCFPKFYLHQHFSSSVAANSYGVCRTEFSSLSLSVCKSIVHGAPYRDRGMPRPWCGPNTPRSSVVLSPEAGACPRLYRWASVAPLIVVPGHSTPTSWYSFRHYSEYLVNTQSSQLVCMCAAEQGPAVVTVTAAHQVFVTLPKRVAA